MNAFDQGKKAKKLGKSKEYNPYRHKGSPEDYTEWINGWNS